MNVVCLHVPWVKGSRVGTTFLYNTRKCWPSNTASTSQKSQILREVCFDYHNSCSHAELIYIWDTGRSPVTWMWLAGCVQAPLMQIVALCLSCFLQPLFPLCLLTCMLAALDGHVPVYHEWSSSWPMGKVLAYQLEELRGRVSSLLTWLAFSFASKQSWN